jgi:hypothetical protein
MNDAAFNPTANGHVQELDALDKAAGEAAPELEAREARLGMQLDRLARLADMGMELAEGLTRKAARIEAEPQGEGRAEEIAPGYEGVCLAFTRITRAIRQINAQEQEILGLREQARREARQMRAELEATTETDRKDAQRRRVVDTVRDLLKGDDEIDPNERDDYLADLRRDYDDYHDLYQGSFDQIVERIRRDLGIAEPKPKRARAKRAKASKPDGGGAPDPSDDPDDEVWRRPYVPRAHGRDPP